MPQTPVSRGRSGRTAADVAAALRRQIVSRELPPGAKLREIDLAARLGTSRSRVREALVALEERGLVERVPNRGAVVARLEAEQAADLYDVREVLEGLCARLATLRGPKARWAKALKAFRGPLARLVDRGELDAYVDAYEAFHAEMVAAAGNPILAAILASICDRTQSVVRRTILVPGRAAVGLRQHQRMLEAMAAGDADRAERLRRETMRSAKAALERYRHYVL
jgi:DNA-binding GntR family transcriptional regulator